MALLRELHAAGQTLIIATHDPTIGDLSDRVIYLHHGRLMREQRHLGKRWATSEGLGTAVRARFLIPAAR